ncbi:MAG: EcsC family protein [Pseudomonadota bacterium]
MKLSETDRRELEVAHRRLENPSLAIRLSSAVGMPVEAVLKQLSAAAPPALADTVIETTRDALEYVLFSTAKTFRDSGPSAAKPGLHKAAAVTTGAVSGFLGPQALAVELPVTTAIMFRSIVDIARAEGETPTDEATILQAMQVFAMGSDRSAADDAAETTYYGVRLALSKAMGDALKYVATQGVGSAGAPSVVRLIAAVASRFGVVVTQKAMAQALPVLGAIGGGLVNTVFISHFQDMARGHFAVRRLEREYGEDAVREAYSALVVGETKD